MKNKQEQYIIEKLQKVFPDKQFEYVVHNEFNGWNIRVLTVDGEKLFPKWESVGVGTEFNTDSMKIEDVIVQAYIEAIG